jgi:hypothetical protein
MSGFDGSYSEQMLLVGVVLQVVEIDIGTTDWLIMNGIMERLIELMRNCKESGFLNVALRLLGKIRSGCLAKGLINEFWGRLKELDGYDMLEELIGDECDMSVADQARILFHLCSLDSGEGGGL